MKTLAVLFLIFMANPPRQVLLFYNEHGVPTQNAQLAEFDKNKAGMRERDIVTHCFSFDTHGEEWKKWAIDPAKPFTFILIGRDGGEKFRSDKIVLHQDLFNTIDAMPMRRSEMKKQ